MYTHVDKQRSCNYTLQVQVQHQRDNVPNNISHLPFKSYGFAASSPTTFALQTAHDQIPVHPSTHLTVDDQAPYTTIAA